MEPLCPEAPKKVLRQVQMDLDHTFYPEKPLVPYIKVTQDRCVLEIQRGCTRGCRFCQAGMVYRPLRERSLSMLERVAENSLKATGNDEISLSSLSSSDYRKLPELCNYLIENFRTKNINISLPSLRIDAFSLDVMSKVQDVRKSSLTFAPEAGTQRMRNIEMAVSRWEQAALSLCQSRLLHSSGHPCVKRKNTGAEPIWSMMSLKRSTTAAAFPLNIMMPKQLYWKESLPEETVELLMLFMQRIKKGVCMMHGRSFSIMTVGWKPWKNRDWIIISTRRDKEIWMRFSHGISLILV